MKIEDLEKALQYFVIAVPESEEQAKAYFWARKALTALRSMPTLTPPNEPEHAGLYGKYTVYKNKDGSLVTDCFILRPAKDPAAVAALRAYAAATDNAELAASIDTKDVRTSTIKPVHFTLEAKGNASEVALSALSSGGVRQPFLAAQRGTEGKGRA